MDLKYEELVTDPTGVLRRTCDFVGEDYVPEMLSFFETDLAKKRGATKDHRPLGHAVSDRYVGIYKTQLSLRDQRIFAWVAGAELKEAGYACDVEPSPLTEEQVAYYREVDGRFRAVMLTAPEGHIVFESYNDWLVDRREERRRAGLWRLEDAPRQFPIGHPNEEMIQGLRANRKWKDYFGVKRQYGGNASL
jgi:hypothetical protein